MTKEDQKTSPSENPAAQIHEIVAVYSQMFLSDIDRHIREHLEDETPTGGDSSHKPVSSKKLWNDSDLV